MIIDELTTEEGLLQFLKENTYDTRPQWEYKFVWVLAIPTKTVTDRLISQMSMAELNMDRFSELEKFENYTIFLNDFMKNIRHI
jgi:hypothetical protein